MSYRYGNREQIELFPPCIDDYVSPADPVRAYDAFVDAKKYRKSVDKRHKRYAGKKRYFTPSDFKFDSETGRLTCPAGNKLYIRNRKFKTPDGYCGTVYIGWKTKCRTCSLRSQCIRGKKMEVRQVVIVEERHGKHETFTDWMKERFDSVYGKFIYSRRIGTVESVFANICSNIGLNRFTLRGKHKVDIQWKLFCIVHNIGKKVKYAPRFAI